MNELFETILNHQIRDAERGHIKLEYRVIWKACQWSSVDGTEKELREMYQHHGIPGGIEINLL